MFAYNFLQYGFRKIFFHSQLQDKQKEFKISSPFNLKTMNMMIFEKDELLVIFTLILIFFSWEMQVYFMHNFFSRQFKHKLEDIYAMPIILLLRQRMFNFLGI